MVQVSSGVHATKAGEVCVMEIELSGSGDQQNAIQGASYLQDIGDWHNKNVQGSMIIQGRMLRDIRLGSKTEPIVISITSLTLSNCTSLQRLLLSNISTLSGTLNLSACTHLQEVHADGTSLVQIILPKGGGLQSVEFSAYNQYLSLMNYPLMTNEGVGIGLGKEIISDFFITGCPMINPMALLVDIMDAQSGQGSGHKLKRIRAVGFNETYNDSSVLDKLVALSNGTYEGLSAEGLSGEDEYPVLDGILNVHASVYEDSLETLRTAFKKLELNITGGLYLRFQDPVVQQICISQWGDGHGVTRNSFISATTLPSNLFSDNKDIQYFSEFGDLFVNCTKIMDRAFQNCSNLKVITLPEGLETINLNAFANCTSLSEIELPEGVTLNYAAFGGTGLVHLVIPGSTIFANGAVFNGCNCLVDVIIEEGVKTLMSNMIFKMCDIISCYITFYFDCNW